MAGGQRPLAGGDGATLKSIRHFAHLVPAIELAACFWLALTFFQIERQVASWRQARPPFTPADVRAAAIAATYEAQVLPEAVRAYAYRAIVWTMRNRVATGYNGVTGYSDERLLDQYIAYRDHQQDIPDSRALESAAQVLAALTSADDPTKGARHYVDNSYWTGTHEQTGAVAKFRDKFSDTDVQRLVDEGRFTFTIEWRSSPGHPQGPLFYGLYFFDSWPPPVPVPSPTSAPPVIGTATTAASPAAMTSMWQQDERGNP